MAHQRPRHAEPLLLKLLAFSPIVGIFGHRQVGKTSILEKTCAHYVTFDVAAVRARAEADPEGFLRSTSRPPLGIDEAQYVPTLFPALKEFVRIHKRPGQFLLSGSVRFTSRRAIRESLTGRIVHLELLPFTQAELDQRSMNLSIFAALAGAWDKISLSIDSTKSKESGAKLVDRYLVSGGLPGSCFIRSAILRSQHFASQLETILDRDLRLVWKTTLPFETLRNMLANLALIQGTPLELQDLARKTRVSVPTWRTALSAFESIFLIRRVPTRGTEKRPVVFFEDQGEASHLLGRPLDILSDMTRCLFAQIHSPLRINAVQPFEIFQFRTRGGAFAPLAVRIGTQSVALIPIVEENPNRHAIASATSFLKRFKDSKVVFVSLEEVSKVITDDLYITPISAFL